MDDPFPPTASGNPVAKMEFEFSPDWRFLRQLRHFVSHMVTVRTADSDLAFRVGMTVTELAENAIKYATSASASVRVFIRDDAVVRIEAENDAASAQIQELVQILDQVNQGDSMEAYARALTGAAAAASALGTSKVGLARVRFEGQMVLKIEVSAQRILLIAEPADAEVAKVQP